MYKHFDAPFPNDHDKKLLASITGMPRSQVRHAASPSQALDPHTIARAALQAKP